MWLAGHLQLTGTCSTPSTTADALAALAAWRVRARSATLRRRPSRPAAAAPHTALSAPRLRLWQVHARYRDPVLLLLAAAAALGEESAAVLQLESGSHESSAPYRAGRARSIQCSLPFSSSSGQALQGSSLLSPPTCQSGHFPLLLAAPPFSALLAGPPSFPARTARPGSSPPPSPHQPQPTCW